MSRPTPAVTNHTENQNRGMTLRELARFVTDCLRSPIPVDQDEPLFVRSTMTGRILNISAPLEPCTCPKWPGSRTPLHHPSCSHRIPAATR